MCGLLLIDSARPLAPERIAAAEQYLKRRGPNVMRRWQRDHIQIWHSVLHITGNEEYYYQQQEDFCGFAGEIYNYQELGYDSDAWCVHATVRSRPGRLQQLKGPSSWIYSTGEFVCYASDPQGERHLYRYQDQHTTIVASEVAVIAALVDLDTLHCEYQNKGWNLLTQTPYRGVERLESGRLYINHKPAHMIDSIFDWCGQTRYPSLAAATEEFAAIWRRVMQSMMPQEPATISFSGGIDSSLIAAAMPQADLLALDMQGKDPNIAELDKLLSQDQCRHLNTMSITPEYYAGACLDMIQHTRMPAQSWSHVGKWLVAKHAGNRVLFSGAGADELFGGYTVYRSIQYDRTGSVSPYSQWHDAAVWQRCLNACSDDAASATLLLDYLYQVMACDSQGLDRAAGAWSKEIRNPFMHPDVVKFALNLPWSFRVDDDCKPILKRLWRRSYPTQTMWSKQGFAGHANDSLPWLPVNVSDTGDRLRDWQQISKSLFYQTVTNQSNVETSQQ